MKKYLLDAGYILDEKSDVWVRPGYDGIRYSDGDEVEQRIAGIVKEADDISVLSVELRQHCTDWASLYHLTSTRANILRPFESSLRGEILEIGAGCGAITRYLGECGANVVALEGSPRRAAIARSRTRDLTNVTLVADKFDQFQTSHRFDVITLIGVFEYANMFTDSADPGLTMLRRVRLLLKPNGKLVIAIENQLGLKYFAGAPEDHLGQPMYGIEGRYRKDQPQTYGRTILSSVLSEAGFAASEFLLPFPDYKLPVSILTEEGLSRVDFDSAAFAWQSVRRDPQLPANLSFSPELVWPAIFDNQLSIDLANSFLIIASQKVQVLQPGGVLAYHYSTERVPEFCKETIFKSNREAKSIVVEYKQLGGDVVRKSNTGALINFIATESDVYRFGRSLSYEFIKLAAKDDCSIEDIKKYLKQYLTILAEHARAQGATIDFTCPYSVLPGDFFDIIPNNLIVHADGSASIIDKEWCLTCNLELGYLILRALLQLIGSVSHFGRSDVGRMTRGQMIIRALDSLGLSINSSDLGRYLDIESQVQRQVSGRDTSATIVRWPDHILRSPRLHEIVVEQDGKIASLNHAVAELDGQIAGLNHAIAERDGQIASLNRQLQGILNSKSWRLTKPIRHVRRILSGKNAISWRTYFYAAVRRLWLLLPLSPQTKRRLKSKLFNVMPMQLLHAGAYQACRSASLVKVQKNGCTESAGSALPRKTTLVSMAKNEINIIETFAAHALEMFDRVIFVDHQSTDGTQDYLHHLASIYPQVEVFRFDEDGYYQSEVMTWVVTKLIGPNDSGWVFFLDADEFLPFRSRAEFEAELKKYSPFPVISMPWLNLIPLEMDRGEVNGERFLKPAKAAIHHKIAVQPSHIPFEEYIVAQGNHALLIGEHFQQPFPAEDAFSIYHLPIRSRMQLSDKIRYGVESYRKMGSDRDRSLGVHWDEINQLISQNGITDELMMDIIARYGEQLSPPYGTSVTQLKKQGYSEIRLNICVARGVPKATECGVREGINRSRLTEPHALSSTASKRGMHIALDGGTNTLRFRSG